MIAPDRSTLAPPGRVLGPLTLAAAFECGAWVQAALPGVLAGSWHGRASLLIAVHALTLGCLALSVTGAGWQLVPVVTARPWTPRLAPVVNGALIIGLVFTLPGFALGSSAVGAAGVVMVLAALALRSILVLPALLRASGRLGQRLWLLGAEGSLWVGLALGGALWLGRAGWWAMADPLAALGWHVRLLLGGWLLGWIVGTGSLLVPMFAVGREPRAPVLLVAGALWAAGLVSGVDRIVALGAVVGLGALLWSLARGVRVGAALAQAGVGLAGLVLSTSLGALGLVSPEGAVTAAIALGALPLLRGVALRIVPFLAWTHAYGARLRGAPPVARLAGERAGALAGALGVLGGALVVFGGGEGLSRVGAALAACGAAVQLGVLGRAVLLGWLGMTAGQALAGTERT